MVAIALSVPPRAEDLNAVTQGTMSAKLEGVSVKTVTVRRL